MQETLSPYSGFVLELKSTMDVPTWMVDMVREFNLVRCGNCKYSAAIWEEALFRGTPHAPRYATELFTY